MRKVSAGIMLMMMMCTCAYGSISREVVEAAWRRMSDADNLPELPISYEDTVEVNARSILNLQNGNYSVSVTTALMKILNTEEEIAAVWGHEIGHIRYGHIIKSIQRKRSKEGTYEALVKLGTQKFKGLGSAAVILGGKLMLELSDAGFSRGEEVEADDYGVELLKKAGYDPYAAYRAQKILAENGAFLHPDGFNDHPPTERRLLHLLNKAREVEGLTALASLPEEQQIVKRPVTKRTSRSTRKRTAKTSTTTSVVVSKPAEKIQAVVSKQEEPGQATPSTTKIEGLVASVPKTPAETETLSIPPRTRSVRPAVATVPEEPQEVQPATTRSALPAVATLQASTRTVATRTAASRPVVTQVSERLTVQPGGVRLEGSPTYSGAVIGAYQKVYAMNFEVWKPADLPAGWYATFDGFPVAQIAENRWVYGQLGIDGAIHPTNILVGSVVPSSVPGITRIAAVWSYGKAMSSKEFQSIRDQMCNRMGWLNDEYVNTIIAWHTHRIGVWVWLGDRWRRFEPRSGEYTWQMLKRVSPYIADELRKNHAWYQGGEPTEVADLARQWGYIWTGRVILRSLKAFRDSGGDSSGQVTSMRETSTSESTSTTPPEVEQTPAQWDVD